MKKYWEGLPNFRHQKQAQFCADDVKTYFNVEARVHKVAHDDSYAIKALKIFNSVAKKFNVTPLDTFAPSWTLVFSSGDKEKDHMIECFIVAWGKGFEGRGIFDLGIK